MLNFLSLRTYIYIFITFIIVSAGFYIKSKMNEFDRLKVNNSKLKQELIVKIDEVKLKEHYIDTLQIEIDNLLVEEYIKISRDNNITEELKTTNFSYKNIFNKINKMEKK